jgi:hypothetical protein
LHLIYKLTGPWTSIWINQPSMNLKSKMQDPASYSSLKILEKKIAEFVSGGLTEKEANDLAQIELIENENSPLVPLSEAEIIRKRAYLEKLTKGIRR